MNVLDFVSVGDLAAIASMSDRNRQLIVDHYLTEINNATLQIIIANAGQNSRAYYLPANKTSAETIHLCDGHDQLLVTLQALCPVFAKLDITFDFHYEFQQTLTEQVAQIVNAHCAEVPQRVAIRTAGRSTRAFSFENVTSVWLKVAQDFVHFAVDKHFPRVEQLALDIYDRFTLKQHLPHLRHFEVDEIARGQFDLRTFGELNPHIRSIRLATGGLLDTMHEVNELFPNLEALHYRPRPPPIESIFSAFLGRPAAPANAVRPVRFRHVRRYTLDVSTLYGLGAFDEYVSTNLAKSKLSTIEFDRLEHLEFISQTTNHLQDQLSFITRYRSLRSLGFSSFVMSHAIVVRVVGSLPHLKAIKLSCKNTGVADVLQLMNGNNQLETIHVLVLDGESGRQRFLDATLPGQWNVVVDRSDRHKNGVIFKRNELN